MRQFSEDDVCRLLSMREAIERLRDAFRQLGSGEAVNQVRRRMKLAEGTILHSMAGAWRDYLGTKIYVTCPGREPVFLFHLFERSTARHLALFEANHLGQIRTGAATGVAIDWLAPKGIVKGALIGAGFQARGQLEALLEVRTPQEIAVWSRNELRAAQLVADFQPRTRTRLYAVVTAEEAVREAEVVITATSAGTPVVKDSWLASRVLVCAIGSNYPNRRELPAELVRTAAVVVDDLEAAKTEAGDLILGFETEREWDLVKPLAAFADGQLKPEKERVVFKSVGLGVEDVAVAALVYEKATPGQA
jgi:ornithine cyclodeaminase/alanine dehydrogenase-like protein (mu-crystallin family)